MKDIHKILWCFITYYLYTTYWNPDSTNGEVLRDLTHVFDKDTIYWVTDKELNFSATYNGTWPGNDFWYQADEISAATHGGTHIDAPCHFARGGWSVSDIPIERLVVPAAIIDISDSVGDDPGVHLQPEHIIEWEKQNGEIADGSLLLVRTGWSRFWPDRLKFTGSTERNESLLNFPSIKPEAAKWLIANRNIVGVGIDTMSLDVPDVLPLTHITLMENSIYGLENVNLEEPLPATGTKMYVMPMKLKNASGAPCRILAQIPGNIISTTYSCCVFVSLIWILTFTAVLSRLSIRF